MILSQKEEFKMVVQEKLLQLVFFGKYVSTAQDTETQSGLMIFAGNIKIIKTFHHQNFKSILTSVQKLLRNFSQTKWRKIFTKFIYLNGKAESTSNEELFYFMILKIDF